MKLDKKIVIVISVVATLLIICVTTVVAFRFSKKDKEPSTETVTKSGNGETEPDTKDKDSEDSESVQEKEYRYNNIDGLYFIPSQEHENLKAAIEQYLSKNSYDVTDITITDTTETEDENFYTFWILLDNTMLLKGNYNYELGAYSFVEETDKDRISQFVDISAPDDEEAPDDVYAYMELTIQNLGELETLLPKEDLERLPDEFISFLDKHYELRRLFTITDIKNENTSIHWVFTFDTPRIDGKNVSVTYKENAFVFELE